MEDKKTRGNKKMRSAAVREEMMGMMRAGEAPKDMKERLDRIGRESDSEYRRETKDMGMRKGGSVNENKMLKRRGRNMTKAAMQKEATKAVRKHEKAMHGMKSGGSVSKRADGIAQRGKTNCKIV